jgi:hypothetical protein
MNAMTERFSAVVRRAGYSSLGAWSVSKGFDRTFAYRTVKIYGDGKKMPQGVKGDRIITALRKLEHKQGQQS